MNDDVKNNENSLLTYSIYHCLVITFYMILLDTVPNNMVCSTLSNLPNSPWKKRERKGLVLLSVMLSV